MEWYVYRYDFNKREIVPFNVFRRADFKEDVEEIDIKNISYKDLKNRLDRLTLYYFWSKCEYEVVITSWPPFITKEDAYEMMNQFEKDSKRYEREPLVINANLEVGEKIDIYKQLHLNWDAFCGYVYNELNKH